MFFILLKATPYVDANAYDPKYGPISAVVLLLLLGAAAWTMHKKGIKHIDEVFDKK